MENTEQNARKLRECLRCGHEWFTRLEVVKRCAGCKSPYWDVARGTGVVIQHPEAAARLLADARGAGAATEPPNPAPRPDAGRAVATHGLVGGAGMMFPKDKWKAGGAKKKWKKGAK